MRKVITERERCPGEELRGVYGDVYSRTELINREGDAHTHTESFEPKKDK